MNKIEQLIYYILTNKRKITFTIFVTITIITGIISTYGALLNIPMPIINGATTISGILAGVSGKSWKDYFKFNEEFA